MKALTGVAVSSEPEPVSARTSIAASCVHTLLGAGLPSTALIHICLAVMSGPAQRTGTLVGSNAGASVDTRFHTQSLVAVVRVKPSPARAALWVETCCRHRSAHLTVRHRVCCLVCAAEAMPLTQGDVGLVHRLDIRFCCHDDAVTEVSAAHSPPVLSEEVGSAHHMKDEEGRGEQQRLVHCLPLSHVSSPGLSHTLLFFSVPVGGKRRRG